MGTTELKFNRYVTIDEFSRNDRQAEGVELTLNGYAVIYLFDLEGTPSPTLKLLQAAPDLLAICKQFVRAMDIAIMGQKVIPVVINENSTLLEEARAAIAKAEGGA